MARGIRLNNWYIARRFQRFCSLVIAMRSLRCPGPLQANPFPAIAVGICLVLINGWSVGSSSAAQIASSRQVAEADPLVRSNPSATDPPDIRFAPPMAAAHIHLSADQVWTARQGHYRLWYALGSARLKQGVLDTDPLGLELSSRLLVLWEQIDGLETAANERWIHVYAAGDVDLQRGTAANRLRLTDQKWVGRLFSKDGLRSSQQPMPIDLQQMPDIVNVARREVFAPTGPLVRFQSPATQMSSGSAAELDADVIRGNWEQTLGQPSTDIAQVQFQQSTFPPTQTPISPDRVPIGFQRTGFQRAGSTAGFATNRFRLSGNRTAGVHPGPRLHGRSESEWLHAVAPQRAARWRFSGPGLCTSNAGGKRRARPAHGCEF